MSNNRVVWLADDDPPDAFPPVSSAVSEPEGLLAAGSDLSIDRLLYAYANGIFPWYEEGQPVLWWSPDPRCVFRPGDYRVSRRMRREIIKSGLTIRVNTAFSDVIRACAGARKLQQGTWITAAIVSAFETLHRRKWAHSIEVWDADVLVGGLYGLCIGKVFFGESMFSARPNTSKMALLYLANQMIDGHLELLDCQVASQHLCSLGARVIPRIDFIEHLDTLCVPAHPRYNWSNTPISASTLRCN